MIYCGCPESGLARGKIMSRSKALRDEHLGPATKGRSTEIIYSDYKIEYIKTDL